MNLEIGCGLVSEKKVDIGQKAKQKPNEKNQNLLKP